MLMSLLMQLRLFEMPNFSTDLTENSDQNVSQDEEISSQKDDTLYEVDGLISSQASTLASETVSEFDNSFELVESTIHTRKTETLTVDSFSDKEKPTYASLQSDSVLDVDDVDDNKSAPGNYSDVSAVHDTLETMSENSQESSPPSASASTEGVLFLLRQAVENGSAVILDRSCLDADAVYQRSVAFAQVAPPGPVFRHRPLKVAIQKSEKKENGDLVVDKAVPVPEKKSNEKKPKEKKSSRTHSHRAKDIKEDYLNVVPQGSLKVDELAKLLA